MKYPSTREEFATWLYENGHRVGVEVGVEKGKYTEVLCKAGLEVYAIDPWKAYKGYREHVSQEKLDGFYQETIERLQQYKAHIIRELSVEASYSFDDESLDFVYLDANHTFVHIAQDLDAWTRKVKKGGVVSGHDYRRYGGKYGREACHVKDVVDAWVRAYQIDGMRITEADNSPSWFYVKS